MNDDQRMVALQALSSQFRTDVAVQIACQNVCEKFECPDIGHLASSEPDAFDELYEAVSDMVEQMPTFETQFGMAVGENSYMTEWHRADLGDHPAIGDEITAVMFPADNPASVIVYARMQVVSVLKSARGTSVLGPALPTLQTQFDHPERPGDIVGKRGIFWKPYEETS